MASLLQEFSKIVSWRRGSERAPHKPLLVLYALGRLSRGNEQTAFSELEGPLTQLLRDFGPSRTRLHPEYPFVRLQNDGVWVLQAASNIQYVSNQESPLLSDLRAGVVLGGFRPDIIRELKKSTNLLSRLIQQILENNFPASLHEEIINRCGIKLTTTQIRRYRSPEFRANVLDAYKNQCAVCGHSLQIVDLYPALEAAHIKWHAMGGKDLVTNGLALCSTHHKLFDFGAFGIREGIVEFSARLGGNHMLDFHLGSFHGRRIFMPVDVRFSPSLENLDWHYSEVFKQPAKK